MLTTNELKNLADVSGTCLTIYQPLRDEYSQVTKPETRVVAAIQEAERLLGEKGFGPEDRDDMLRPVRKIASHTDWAGRTGSLVMFRSPGFTMTQFWPDILPQRVCLAEEFLVLPLLPACLSERNFWLLGLSTKEVRLFCGSPGGLAEVTLPAGVPRGVSEAGEFDQPDHSLRNRSIAGPSVGGMKGVQFGTASSAHEVKVEHLHDFFKLIDRGIRPVLAADRHPLILAGVARELAIYRKINTYGPLLADGIHGSPNASGTHDFYAKAMEMIFAHTAQQVQVTSKAMEEAANRGLLVTDPVAIINAARAGLVRELIISPGAAGFAQREEVINWVALATIRNSGRITFLNSPKPVAGTGFATITRFRPPEQDRDEALQHAVSALSDSSCSGTWYAKNQKDPVPRGFLP
jgi:hypothetical protein